MFGNVRAHQYELAFAFSLKKKKIIGVGCESHVIEAGHPGLDLQVAANSPTC